MRTLTFKRLIGSGAMGTVYEAELGAPRGFCRPCAVKVMKNASPDHEHFMARMRDEARLLGMLQDEHILGVTELVLVDGRDAVVMEYVEGVDLADLIKSHRTPSRALAELAAEIAGTLYRAHTASHPTDGKPLNVIHRDVKPANVMVTARGGIRLLDFGVARAVFSSRESQTQGLVLGTLNYFPPEILAGHEPSSAVDIYGLGLTLWECAAGRDWGSPQVKRDRFDRRVRNRLRDIEDEYSAILPILRRILSWDPNERPHGGEIEREMLRAADNCPGEGLRTWARRVVPPLLEARKGNAAPDPMVGRTIPIVSPPEELAIGEIDLPPRRIPDPTAVTYDELHADPEIVKQLRQDDIKTVAIDISGVKGDSARPPTKRRRRRKKKGMSTPMVAALAFLVVLFLGTLAIIFVALLTVLLLTL